MLRCDKTCERLMLGEQHQKRDHECECHEHLADGEHPGVDGGIPVGLERHDPVDKSVSGREHENQQRRSARPFDPVLFKRIKRASAPALLIFVLSTTYAFIDWIMSLEPDWYSTIYPWMFTVGEVLMTFAFMIALLVLLSKHEPLASFVTPQHYHDLSNLMLAFTMLWAYMSFAQFLIIWAENLPDEIPWYVRRFSVGWGYVAWFISIFHFCVPFFLLLMRFVKKHPERLRVLAIWMICVRVVDVFWIVAPAFRQHGLEVYWTDLAALLGIGGIWIAFFIRPLKSRPLLPANDPKDTYSLARVHGH